jgi:hypothetical protein
MVDVYEKYHSELNRDHIYGIVTDILNKEYGIVLQDIDTSKDDFQNQLIKTFSSNQNNDLVSLNKSLIDTFVSYAKDNYKKTDIDNKLTDLLKERETIFQKKNPEIVPSHPDPIKEDEVKITKNETYINDGSITLNSVKRSSVLSSRYCYSYDLQKHDILSESIRKLSKIIIPIEESYIFSHPIIYVNIKELDYSLNLQKTGEIDNGYRKYGIYESFDTKILSLKQNIQKITIDIRDISETKYTNYDVVKVNQLTIKDNVVDFVCSQIQTNDYLIGDMIKLININSRKYRRLFSYPLKIKEIKGNHIICDLDDEYNDIKQETIDMKILNVSNQNMIYFN